MSQLRQRMDEAMVLRGFAERTRESYLACVAALARYYRRSPDQLGADELQAYLLYLVTEKKLAYASVNQAACAFRFLFDRVLERPRARFDIPMAKVPKRLPQILSREEVARLIGAAGTLRGRTLLTVTYAAGLRVSEVCALQVTDIESAPDRMCLKVRQGKGNQDRYTLLSPRLLDTLRIWWQVGRPGRWLFAACRTAALGGHVETCDACGTTRHVYRSCRNRHCPLCQTRAKEAWLAARRREVLPVPYFHLVFTLPHDLNGLIGQCPRIVNEMLFAAASGTLTEFAANPRWLDGTPAFTLVLHTWKQDLGRHVHVHALVAGGALTTRGEWAAAKRGFLFPVRALSKVFRGKFAAALKGAHQDGTLSGAAVLSEGAWCDLLTRLYAHEWVVYAKQPLGGPAQVLEYLSRYTHRVAISNERIVGIDHGEVVFRVRSDTTSGKHRTLRMPGTEFINRFLKHVLPTGFKRIRHYGLLAPARKVNRLALARSALDAPTPDPVAIESVEAFMRRVERIEWHACGHCGAGHFMPTGSLAPLRTPGASSRGPPCA